ncbi:hypothetical protein D3C86_1309740 [compost metagenome]
MRHKRDAERDGKQQHYAKLSDDTFFMYGKYSTDFKYDFSERNHRNLESSRN